MDEDTTTKLKASIYLSVAKFVESKTADLNVGASPSFVASLVELVYNQLVEMGEDLELFADHAGRTVVNSSDVYMLARRNDALTAALKEYEKTLPR